MQDKRISPTTGRAIETEAPAANQARPLRFNAADESFPPADDATAAVRKRSETTFLNRHDGELRAMRRDVDSLRGRNDDVASRTGHIACAQARAFEDRLKQAVAERPLMMLGAVAALSFVFATMRAGAARGR